jgi:hypothetical protein
MMMPKPHHASNNANTNNDHANTNEDGTWAWRPLFLMGRQGVPGIFLFYFVN